MSRTRIVKGTYTKITGGNHNMYSGGNIIFSAREEIRQTGVEGGVVYGNADTYENSHAHAHETCNYTSNPVMIGTCDYYVNRFKDFMKRHANCKHSPPVYYYGPLRNVKAKGELDIKEIASISLSEFYNPDVTNRSQRIQEKLKKAREKKLKEDNSLPEYKRSGAATVIPSPRESYGYKYCNVFTNELMSKLSPKGQEWLKETKRQLQVLMEKGVVEKAYVSTYNKNYNIRNGLATYTEDNDGNEVVMPKDAEVLSKFYTNIEINNTKFQDFAFATHPDAYDPVYMSRLPLQDLVKIGLTPEFKEWMGAETWEQAWVMAKNMDPRSVGKASWEKLKNDVKQNIQEAEGVLKHKKDQMLQKWKELFNPYNGKKTL